MRTMRNLIAFGIGLLLAGSVASAFANGNHGKNSHGENEGGSESNSTSRSGAAAGATAEAGALAGALSRSGAESVSHGGDGGAGGTGGAGGAGGLGGQGDGGDASAAGGNGGSSDSSNGGVTTSNKSTYLNLQMAMVNIEGCMTAKHVGGGNSTGGALIQWGSLNIPCVLNEMAEGERHVETRALLKCASKPYREAIAFEQKGSRVEKQRYCVDYTVKVTLGEINYLRELVALQETKPPGK